MIAYTTFGTSSRRARHRSGDRSVARRHGSHAQYAVPDADLRDQWSVADLCARAATPDPICSRLDSTGGSPQQLTAGRGTENTNPTLSPDGRRIVFVSGRKGPPELYIMDSDGTDVSTLTDYDFSDKNVSVRPRLVAGRAIGRVSGTHQRQFQIRTFRVAGGTPKLLTDDGENEQPSWAPDATASGVHVDAHRRATAVGARYGIEPDSSVDEVRRIAARVVVGAAGRAVDAPV